MDFERIIKLARAEARARYGAACPDEGADPVAALTSAMREAGDDAKPHWMYDTKKNNPLGNDHTWGPPTPLGAGDAAERNMPFAAGLNIVFGGV